jgi:hypothetical protein
MEPAADHEGSMTTERNDHRRSRAGVRITPNVAFWHFADKPPAFAFVGYWSNNRQRLKNGPDSQAVNDP